MRDSLDKVQEELAQQGIVSAERMQEIADGTSVARVTAAPPITDAELDEWERRTVYSSPSDANIARRLIAEVRQRRADAAAGNELIGELLRHVDEAAPIVKVTECVGQHSGHYVNRDGGLYPLALGDMMPLEAHSLADDLGPRCRFRVTVEAWPEEEAKP